MGGAGAGDLDHLHRATGVERRPAQHVEELLLANQPGAGEGGEQAARLHRAQRQLVHVQILLQRGDHLLTVAGHLGRIQHHHVPAIGIAGGHVTQPREDVGLHEAHARIVEAGVGGGDLQHRLVNVHAGHLGGPARGGIDAEAAGVAAKVQHSLAFALAREPFAVLTLVGKETGLVRASGIGAEFHPVLGDHRRLGRNAAAEIEALLLLHVLVGRSVDTAAGEMLAQRVVDPLAMAEHARGEEFDHQQVGVAIDDQAGQPVALAVHRTPAVGHFVQP